ncbi:MAG: hypothetical protein Q9159_005864 [Coniocarpon cinnabarinum]
MSANEGGGDPSIPFGFTFVQQDELLQSGQDESHAPSGPPLLDNNETGLLRDFFDNPNNIDPGFLAMTQSRQHDHDPYSTSPQHQWFSPNEPSAHSAHTSDQPSPIRLFGGHYGATDDVYAAARLLHSNHTTYTNGSMGHEGFPSATRAPAAAMYGFAQTSQPDFHGHNFGTPDVAAAETGMYPGIAAHSQPQSPRRPPPLNFGSDSKFQGAKYAAPSIQRPPEHDLLNLISSFSHDTSASPTQPRHRALPDRSPQSKPSRRKRRRSSVEEEDSVMSDDDTLSKRGKTRERLHDDSSGGDGLGSGGKSHRKTPSKSKATGSPSHRRKSSPGDKKATRENLTEEQKRSNHIQSEQKRRNLIKQGFEDTNHMVPELRAGGFSKSNMLQEAAKFMQELKEGNNRLAAMLGMLDKG